MNACSQRVGSLCVCCCYACELLVSSDLCDDIAKMRRRFQRMPKPQLLFLDETSVRLSEAPATTLVLPGEQPFVLVEESEKYSKRFDMIACINYDRTFAPVIWSPKDRRSEGVKGINTEMLVDYIYNSLGQETAAIDNPPLTLVVDRATIHSEERIMQAFRERGGHVQELAKMPPHAAKRLSPLDNALFHDWKEAIRKRCPLTLSNIEQVMADEWNNIKPELIRAHYKHCALTRRMDEYADCPEPNQHDHAR
jgi:hypothetical protein